VRTNQPSAQDRQLRALWLAILVLASVVVAMIAGVLFYLAGAGIREAITAAGAAFAGVMTLGLAIWRCLTD
jgi:hypothetical protein